jgi:hypothetical protein
VRIYITVVPLTIAEPTFMSAVGGPLWPVIAPAPCEGLWAAIPVAACDGLWPAIAVAPCAGAWPPVRQSCDFTCVPNPLGRMFPGGVRTP